MDSQIIATIIPSPELQENETTRDNLVDFHHIINSSQISAQEFGDLLNKVNYCVLIQN